MTKVNEEEIRKRIFEEAAERAETEISNEIMKETVLQTLTETGIREFTCGPGYMHTYGGSITVQCTTETLSEAIETAEKCNPLSLYLKREGGTSFLPECPELRKRAGNNPEWQAATPMIEPELVQPYVYKIEGLHMHGETKTLFFFMNVAGYIVKAEITVKHDPLTRRKYRIIEGRGKIQVENQGLQNDSGYFSRYLRFWSSDENPSPYVAY